MKLQNYTLRYFIIALLAVIAVWASLFYVHIIEEVYDNIDDGLKNSKLLIVREAQKDPSLLNTPEFGIHQYKITPLNPHVAYDRDDRFINTFEYMEYDEDDEPVRLLQTVFEANGKPYELTIRASMVEEDELMEDIMYALIALYIMLVISIALINHVILKKAWKSFYSTLERLKTYRLGTGQSFKAPKSPIQEFNILGSQLEDVLKHNEDIYQSQKEFIENASHELQTPLAITLNKLELYIDKNNLDDKQLEDIGTINNTLHRLVRLNKSLLMMSKIENRQYTEQEPIDFVQLTKKILVDFEDFAEYKNISLAVEKESSLSFTMNRALAEILLSNLIKNAIVHNYSGGSVVVKVGNNIIEVINTTNGRALDSNLVFQRFHKGQDNTQSTGLGLAIVQSVANLYKLTLTYHFRGQHIFSVKFP